MATLCDRLKQLQAERNVLKKDIAAAVGVSITGYWTYENGKRIPDANVVIALSRFFKCSTDYLLGVSNSPEIKDPAFVDEPELKPAI